MGKKETNIEIVIVPSAGPLRVETIENTLANLQKQVGGYIEVFPVGVAGAIGICNEEGLMKRLPLGPLVPALGHPICGDFLIVRDAGAEFGSLKADQIAFARALFGGDDDDEESPTDVVFPYEGLFGCASQCRARIFNDPTGAVVILDDCAENNGTSVTNSIDLIAMQLCDAFGLDGGHAAWIEHNPDTRSIEDRSTGTRDVHNDENFAQARFSHVERDDEHWILGQPGWEPLSFEQVESLIGVEWEPEWE